MPGPNEETIAPSAPAPVEPVAAPVPAPTPTPPGEPAAPVQPDQATANAAPAASGGVSAAGAAAAHEHPPTLLDKFDEKVKAADKPADKPAEVKAEEKPADPDKPEAPATEPEAAPAPALAPIDYFAAEGGVKLPETIKLDDTQRGEFGTALEAFRAKPSAETAQGILDMGARAMENYAKFVESEQWRVFREMGENNVKAVMADPVLGGAGHDTAMDKIIAAREIIASDAPRGSERYKREISEFNTALRISGAGNMLPILRAFHNAAKFVREAQNLPPTDGRPPKDIGKAPKQPGGTRLVYDNPTSTPNP